MSRIIIDEQIKILEDRIKTNKERIERGLAPSLATTVRQTIGVDNMKLIELREIAAREPQEA